MFEKWLKTENWLKTDNSEIVSEVDTFHNCVSPLLQILITFLRPFGWPLWIMIASSFGIVFLLMLIFSLCVARAESKKGVEHAKSFCDDLYNSLNFTVDAFTPHYIDSYYAR